MSECEGVSYCGLGWKPAVPLLQPGVGWGIVMGFGLFFAIITLAAIEVLNYFKKRSNSSEWFHTAGRNVNMGLTASVIVSQWTW